MATSYSALKTEIAAFYDRTNLTDVLDTFIDLCEADMQVECKNLEFEATSTVAVTAGVAALPSDWLGARSVKWLGTPNKVLVYRTPQQLDAANAADPSYVTYYTITGSSLKFADDGDGSVLLTYHAKFTPLSDSATSNAILANYPGAYLFGALKYAAVYCKDVQAATGYESLFMQQMERVTTDSKQRKYSGPLAVVPA